MSTIAASRPAGRRIHPLVRFILRRLAIGVVLLALVSVLVFAATQVLPGDAASAILGRSATPAQKEIYRKQLGLDKPFVVQYWRWVSHVVRGDLGTSVASQTPVTAFISARVGNSLVLALAALVVLLPVSLALGVWSGIRRDRADDHAISVVSLGLIALPEFVTATLLVAFIAVTLGLLPPTSIIESGGALSNPRLLVLPVLTLCLAASPYVIRMVRSGVSRGDAGGLRRDGAPERHPRASGRPAPRAAQRARPDGAGVRAHDPVPDRRHRHRRDGLRLSRPRTGTRPGRRRARHPHRPGRGACSWPPSTSSSTSRPT